MGATISFRPTKKLAGWVEQSALQLGISQGQFIRSHLERARAEDSGTKKFMRLAGVIKSGPRDVSARKGFARR